VGQMTKVAVGAGSCGFKVIIEVTKVSTLLEGVDKLSRKNYYRVLKL
jgi:hypothetical protein